MVRGANHRDFQQVKQIRSALQDISIYVQGMAKAIVDQNSQGDRFDYAQFEQQAGQYFARLSSYVHYRYSMMAQEVVGRAEEIYMFYRQELEHALSKAKIAAGQKPVAEASVNISFGGTPAQSFTQALRRQLQAGQDPAALIKTVGADQVKMIQREMMLAISKGKGFGWATDKVLASMYPKDVDETVRRTAEYNVTRIARTSYMGAVNGDTTGFVQDNQDVFYGSRRVADGRPCLACIAQDGRYYAPGEQLVDHPNGMCVLVPMPYPDEYFNTGQITQPVDDTFDPPLAQQFYTMSDVEQRQVFANDQLYKLWKAEQFDLDQAVVGQFGSPISYRQAALNLDKLGGISQPRAEFVSLRTKNNIVSIIDPKDRGNPNITLGAKKPMGGTTSAGLNLTGDGSDFIGSGLRAVDKARISALYGEQADLPWYTFNQRARELGIYTRKSISGQIYYAVPNS